MSGLLKFPPSFYDVVGFEVHRFLSKLVYHLVRSIIVQLDSSFLSFRIILKSLICQALDLNSLSMSSELLRIPVLIRSSFNKCTSITLIF